MKHDLTMPYHFNNTQAGRTILLALWGTIPMLALSFSVFSIYAGLQPNELLMIGGLLLAVALADLLVAPYLFRTNKGAKGTISSHMIQVEGDVFMGISSGVASATYTPNQFDGVKMVQTSNNGMQMGHVSLDGKNPVPTIRVASLKLEQAEALAAFLTDQLKLPRV